MNSVMATQDWLPTFQQELLLQAALLGGDDAISSWLEWKKSADLANLDGGSARLLPLLYQNLSLHGVEEPIMERLKEEYVNTWRDNELLFYEIATLLRLFHEAGVEILLLKGAALSLHFYKDSGLRPMSDVDILVQPQKAEMAIRLLHQAGWKSAYESPEVLIPYRHAIEFSNEEGRRLDLHWKALWGEAQEANDDDFWEGSIPIETDGVPTRILNSTDQLLHVCAHGAAWNDLPPLRWVADAAIIMRAENSEIDWERLMKQTRMRRLMLPMSDALGYLRKILGANVPADVLATIRNIPASPLECVLYRLRTSPNRDLRRLFTLYYGLVARRSSATPPHQKLLDFLMYLKCFWGLKYLWQIPFYMAYEGTRSAKRIFFNFFRGKKPGQRSYSRT